MGVSETVSAIVAPGGGGRAAAALYLGLRCDTPTGAPARWPLATLDTVGLGRGDAFGVSRDRVAGAATLAIRIPDTWMSSSHARLSRVAGRWAIEDTGSKNQTRVNGTPIAQAVLADGDLIETGQTFFVFRNREAESDVEDVAQTAVPGLDTMSPLLAERYRQLARAAVTTVPMVLGGESGTGKELAARAAHAFSGRSGRFVAVNCAALVDTLAGAELFGHRKGAFTGAADERPGLIRAADGGTLFLDEVADLSAVAQGALLRVLQEGEVLPLGSDRPLTVDIRIVSATHRDLEAEVAAGRFRADLYARLSGVHLILPPLRERREDLPLLVAALLERGAPGRSLSFAVPAVRALYRYRWPLNVRELERCLAGAAALSDRRIELTSLPPALQRDVPAETAVVTTPELSPEDSAIRARLVDALARHDRNLSAVARELGKDRKQVRRWLKRYGV
jgi:transcriptional regulator with GAF, ATPase, and Fis domain